MIPINFADGIRAAPAKSVLLQCDTNGVGKELEFFYFFKRKFSEFSNLVGESKSIVHPFTNLP